MPSTPNGNLKALALAALGMLAIGGLWFALLPRGDDEAGGGDPPSGTAAETRPVFRPHKLSEIVDPRADGWQSEAFAEAAAVQLKRLAKTIVDPAAAFPEGLLAPTFRCSELRPHELGIVSERPGLVVRRAISIPEPTPRDRAGFAALCRELSDSLADSSPPHVLMKVQTVTLAEGTASTRVSYEGATGQVQQTAHWECRWEGADTEQPQLAAIALLDFEETRIEGGPWFADDTAAVLGANRSFGDQLSHGLHHWLGRVERAHGMTYFKRHGLAVGDANGDGRDDLYLCAAGGLPNRLFLQNPDDSTRDASAEFGVDYLDDTASALLVDLDNDGDQDLALAMAAGVQVLENDANRRFVHRAGLAMLDSDLASLSAADYDGDGLLDLYVTVDFAEKGAHAAAGEELPGFIYHDANDGGRNALFRNGGGFAFTDVTAAVGLDANNRRHSLAAAWEDFDLDGDPDLYVANDYGQNCLYRNDLSEGGRRGFTDVAPELGVVDYGSGMSVSWGDYNRDGRADLYVGNMFSNAGNRIARQEQFMRGSDQALRALNLRFAKGNTLFRSSRAGAFEDVGATAGVEMGRWAWSSLFADLDNDGWEDLFVANGYLTTPDSGDL